MLSLAWILGAGCTDATAETAAETGGDESGPCDGDSATTPSGLTWDETGLLVTACGAESGGYDLGMAQTGANPGWGGEDCLSETPAGYDSVDDEGYSVCHGLTGESLRLRSVATPEEVVDGETTLFTEDDAASITYVLFAADSDACLSWGDDPGYYAAYNCTVL